MFNMFKAFIVTVCLFALAGGLIGFALTSRSWGVSAGPSDKWVALQHQIIDEGNKLGKLTSERDSISTSEDAKCQQMKPPMRYGFEQGVGPKCITPPLAPPVQK